MENSFFTDFKRDTHAYIMGAYDVVVQFPKEEMYGASDQLRRASVSIMLNFVEGFARRREKTKLYHFEISYGSAKECKYLLYLARERNWITSEQYTMLYGKIDSISARLWSMIKGLDDE